MTGYYENFNLLKEDDGTPIVGEVEGVTYLEDNLSVGTEIFRVLLMLIQGLTIMGAHNSEYLYMTLGQSMSGFAVNLFLAIDRWAGLGILRPSYRVERYLFQA